MSVADYRAPSFSPLITTEQPETCSPQSVRNPRGEQPSELRNVTDLLLLNYYALVPQCGVGEQRITCRRLVGKHGGRRDL